MRLGGRGCGGVEMGVELTFSDPVYPPLKRYLMQAINSGFLRSGPPFLPSGCPTMLIG